MQVLWLRLITFSSLVCLTLAKEANYNEAEQSLPGNEWLNPYDMIHYDAAAQSFDNTVSLLLISHLFTSLTNYKLKVFFAEPANLLNVTLFLSLCIVFLVFFSVNFLATRCANWFPVETLWTAYLGKKLTGYRIVWGNINSIFRLDQISSRKLVNKLTSVFYVSVLLLIINFVITLSK